MLTDEVIDEDIEALLYAQVYYGKSNNTDLPGSDQTDADLNREDIIIERRATESNKTNIVSDIQKEKDKEPLEDTPDNAELTTSGLIVNNPPDIGKNQNFDNLINHQNQSPYIEISTSSASIDSAEKNPTQIVAQIPLLSAPNNPANHQQQLLNNITINQYIYTGEQFLDRLKIFKKNFIWSKSCQRDLKRLQQGKLDETQFFSKLKRRFDHQKQYREKQEKIRRAVFRRQQNITQSEVICLSDSDNSDVEIVDWSVANIREVKNMEPKGTVSVEYKSYDEDEIIYVPPPPVPVINLEDESGSDKEAEPLQQEQVSLDKSSQELDDASNDFLAPTNTLENFNFSLHGSEFQDAEFVRPANPTDTYETESSTSTSDFNRDSSREFNNSVKTIVFNEVDFPREDIFEGSNLDKFGELITPKRVSETIGDREEGCENSGSPKRVNTRTSSRSSSESDYGVLELHQNLPDLSPMVCVEIIPQKKNRPKNTNFSKENDGILDAEGVESPINAGLIRKSKKRSSGLGVEDDDTPRKKLKKKKKKPGLESKNPDEDLPLLEEANVEPPLKMLLKNSQANWVVMNTPTASVIDTPELSNEQRGSSKKKSKKRKKHETLEQDVSVKADDASKKKSKRKKKSTRNVEEADVLDKTIDDAMMQTEQDQPGDGGRKKGKKRKQKLPFQHNDNADHLDTTAEVTEDSHVSTTVDYQQNHTQEGEGSTEEGDLTKACGSGAQVLIQNQGDEEDVVLIEQDIPLHVIESSDSDNEIITFDDVGDEVELGNITDGVNKTATNEFDVFDVEYIKSKMSDDPEKWKILPTDRYSMNVGKRGPRCNKCRQVGHIAIHCPNKPNIPNCSLCGYEGHEEPRCPNKVCFTCARPGNYSTVFCYKCANQRHNTCQLCQLPGHTTKCCPDLWRRYYLTTEEGPLVRSKRKNMSLKPRNKQWCSGCAGRGHLEFECNSYKWIREYPTTSPKIFKFVDVYESQKRVNKPSKAHTSTENDTGGSAWQIGGNQVPSESVNETEPVENPLQIVTNDHVSAFTFQPPAGINTEPQSRQSPPATESVNFQNPAYRYRESRRWHSKTKLNPLSVINTGYTRYQSVLNPCSLLGANNVAPSNVVPPLFPQATPVRLFNPVANNVLTRQITDLMNVVSDYQRLNNQGDFAQNSSYNAQIPLEATNFSFHQAPSNDYVNLSGYDYMPFQGDYGNRDYLDVPYTITREPSHDLPYDRDGQYNRSFTITENFSRRRPESPTSRIDGFIPFNSEHQENVVTCKPKNLYNVDEATAKKFENAPIEYLNKFLSAEIEKLDNVKGTDAKIYRRKLNIVEHLQKIEFKTNAVKKQMYFHYKHLNMFLFGVQKLGHGKKFLDYLRNFVYNSGKVLNDAKRNALLEAYGYIFGGEHPDFNYRSHLKIFYVGQRRGK